MTSITSVLHRCVLVLLTSTATLVGAQVVKDRAVSIASLLSHSRLSEGKQITVEGSLTATLEAMWLTDVNCPKRLYLSYDGSRDDLAWKEWQDAVNDQIGGIDRRPMHVVVQGVFRGHVHSGNRNIAQLTITKIISWDRKASVGTEVPHLNQRMQIEYTYDSGPDFVDCAYMFTGN